MGNQLGGERWGYYWPNAREVSESNNEEILRLSMYKI